MPLERDPIARRHTSLGRSSQLPASTVRSEYICPEYQHILGIAASTSSGYTRTMEIANDLPRTLVRGKKGLAQYLQIGETMAAELLMSGTILSIKIGRARLVPIAAIEEYLSRLRGEQQQT
jgi:hypothetical protein